MPLADARSIAFIITRDRPAADRTICGWSKAWWVKAGTAGNERFVSGLRYHYAFERLCG